MCNGQYMQQAQGQDKYMLHLPPPQQQVRSLDLSNLVQAKLAMPSLGLRCLSGLACHGQQLHGSTRIQPGQNLITWVNRNNNNIDKIMSPIAEPADNDPLWGRKRCHVVLAHAGNLPVAGHWLAFVKRGGVWWKVDTDASHPVQENPFLSQAMQGGNTNSYTIDIVIFSS